MCRPRLLVTRPAERQEPFGERARALGFETVPFPCLANRIDEPVMLPEAALLSAADAVIFTSRVAVEAVAGVRPFPWPDVSVLAIGEATAAALATRGQPLARAPVAPFTSEALLASVQEELPWGGAVIVKGHGGRQWLGESLTHHGTVVIDVEVYRRERPTIDDDSRRHALLDPSPDIIAVTSDEVLRNLVALAGDAIGVLQPLPLVVNSDRCATLARSLGFDGDLRVAETAGDDGQISALARWLAS